MSNNDYHFLFCAAAMTNLRNRLCFMSTGNMNYLALREHYPGSKIDCIIQKPTEISKPVGRIKTELEQ
jgi:hypothetical protein